MQSTPRGIGMSKLNIVEDDKWLGPCGDSFCYASCDSPDCHWELRLGKTPSEHYHRVALNGIHEIEAARETLQRLAG